MRSMPKPTFKNQESSSHNLTRSINASMCQSRRIEVIFDTCYLLRSREKSFVKQRAVTAYGNNKFPT